MTDAPPRDPGSPLGLLWQRFSATFVVNALGAVLAVGLTLVLARLMGPAGYGAFFFALAAVDVLAVAAGLGFERLLMREVEALHTRGEPGRARGLIGLARRAVLGASVVLGVVVAGGAVLAGPWWDPLLAGALALGMVVLPLRCGALVEQGVLLSLGRPAAARLPIVVLPPLLTLVAAGGLWAAGGEPLDPLAVLGCYAGAMAVSLGIAALWARRATPASIRHAQPTHDRRRWLRLGLPMMALAGMTLVNTRADILMLGLLRGAGEAGVYAVASRLAEAVRFGLFAVNPAIVAMLSRYAAQGDRDNLQRVVTASARLLLLWSVPTAGVLALFSPFWLSLFGEAFVQGRWALVLLALGQLMTVALGAVDTVLVMTGHEMRAVRGFAVATAVNLTLNLALIPPLGIEGAAIATATSAAVWSVLLAVGVRRRLGLNPTAWPTPRTPA